MGIFRRLLQDLGFIRDKSVTVRDELTVSAIRELAQKEQRTPDELAGELLSNAVGQRNTWNTLLRQWDSLSFREQQVIALAVLGYTNPQIAVILNLSVSTVKTYVSTGLHKMRARNRNELAAKLRDWDFEGWAREKIGIF